MFHLGPYHSTFDGGMGDFRKKMSCRLIFEGKNSCKEIPAKKIPIMKKISFKAYKAVKKKSYTVVCREKILSPDFGEIFFLPKPNHPYPHPLPSKVKWLAP